MDNFVDAQGKKSKRELCLFNSTIASFESLLFAKHNIRTLIIIGQRNISLLSAIAELIHIKELWIVECGIEKVPPFKKNCRLEKLYLSSNEISCIPNLDACLSLKVLFLPGNNIRDLKNLQKLIYLEELNLADNKLERINKIAMKKSELQYINLAGNHLRFIRDIRNLSQLEKLKSLVFADLLYGECPLVALCNYRAYVIYQLPDIEKLDHYFIYKKERQWINQFFKKQITYYNVLLHKQMNEHLHSLKRNCEKYEKEMIDCRNQFYAIKVKKDPLKNILHDESQNTMSRMELIANQFTEKKQLAIMRSKTSQQQMKINADYCGNIKFVEYDATPANTVIKLCTQFLEESLCFIVKHNTGITGLKLFKVTKVSNKQLDRLNVEEDENLQSDLNNMILKILITPGVTDIQKWPFNFFTTDLFTGNELMVTSCLAVADAEWLNEMFELKKHGHILNLVNVCQKRRVCVLLQAPIFNSGEKTNSAEDYLHTKHKNYQEDSSQNCQTFKLTTRNVRNPMFVVEYEYVVHEARNLIFLIEKDEIRADTCTSEDSTHISLSNSNISQHINTHGRVEICNLAKICISGQNINSMDTDLDLPNLREFDISFNRLQEFPRSSFTKNIEILNISFNNIKWINVDETLPVLQDLDISWNCLINCLAVIETFKTFIPNMRKLTIHNNPFQDVPDPNLAEYLTYICIPNLQFINHHARGTLNLQQSYFPCAFGMCRLKQHNKLLYLKQNAIENVEQMTVTEKRNLEHAKCIHVSQDFLIAVTVLKRASKIQELCATCCLLTTLPVTRPLTHLTKLNLASNFISVLNAFTEENFPSLKYLDLTNNLIASLEPMKSFHTLQEFYCGSNNIESVTQIDNVKTWETLYIIDLSSNPICNADALYKCFIIFHLSNVKYISGECVQKSDVSEARHIFGNKLDKHVLNTMYSTDQLINITQLSLTDCSLSKVDLSAELLPQLESLDLSKNQINYLWSMHSFQHLHTLCLSYNCLETFCRSDGEGNVYTFPKLCTLFLDHNCIQSLMGINIKLPAIKHLFLHNNYLRNVNGINRFPTLESIVLDFNDIQILAVEDFLGSSNLKYLSIENNKIKSLTFVKELQKLEKLYAANNCLTVNTRKERINIAMDLLKNTILQDSNDMRYLSALTNLEELTLEGNPLYIEIKKDKMIAEDFEVKNAEVEEI